MADGGADRDEMVVKVGVERAKEIALVLGRTLETGCHGLYAVGGDEGAWGVMTTREALALCQYRLDAETALAAHAEAQKEDDVRIRELEALLEQRNVELTDLRGGR